MKIHCLLAKHDGQLFVQILGEINNVTLQPHLKNYEYFL